MDDQLHEMAGRAEAAQLHGLFQVVRSVALPESLPTSDAVRKAPAQLVEFLDGCVKDSGAVSAEAFVLGPQLGPVAAKNPMLVPSADLDHLREWFGFYGRAFRLNQFIDEGQSQSLAKDLRALVKDVANFVQWRLRAFGVKKPY